MPGTATVYAGQNGLGVFKSIDGGLNWTSASSGLGISGSRLRLAMAPSDNNVMYVLNEAKLYRSVDAGANWTLQNGNACEGQCTYNQTLSVHATNPDTVLVGSIRFAKSTNAGVTLTPLTSTWGTSQTVHQDTHVVRSFLGGQRWRHLAQRRWRQHVQQHECQHQHHPVLRHRG